MLTMVCHMKKIRHWVQADFHVHLALMIAAVNVLTGWHGLTAMEMVLSSCRSPILVCNFQN